MTNGMKTLFCMLSLSSCLTSALRMQAQQTAKRQTPISVAAQQRMNALKAIRVKLNSKEESLSGIVEMLAAQLHCSILVDDEPLLQKANVQCDETGLYALDQAADAFDYTWEVSRNGGILMRKRFRNPLEHPQTNFAEVRQMAHDAVLVLSGLHYDPQSYYKTWPFIVRTLFESFTSEQRAIVMDETRKLTMNDLLPSQRLLVSRAIYCSVFENQIRGWNTLAEQLDALPRSWITHTLLSGAADPRGLASASHNSPDMDLLSLYLPTRGGQDGVVTLQAAAHGSIRGKK